MGTMETDGQAESKGIRPDREYNATDSATAHQPFIKIIGYVFFAHTFGLLSCIAIHQQFANVAGVQDIMLTSGLIYAIGLIPTVVAYVVFRSVLQMSQEAAAIDPGYSENRDTVADDMTAEAMKRGKSGFKLLSFSGVCFVASTLIGISGLISL